MGIKTSIIKEIFSDALQLIPNYNDSAMQMMKFSTSLNVQLRFCMIFQIITCIELSQFIFDLYCTKRNNIFALALSVI